VKGVSGHVIVLYDDLGDRRRPERFREQAKQGGLQLSITRQTSLRDLILRCTTRSWAEAHDSQLELHACK
jgi:hypothetical protein